jgi:glycosyltransferase involved in cell wall biosynthesis
MTLPFLSVVVPTYNRREILKRTLPSLLEQTARPGGYEILVVVDGSRDQTVEMLEAHREKSRIRTIVQENRGLAAARNRGAEEARGDVVLFLDDDMIASPELVEAHAEEHARPGERVVFGALGLAAEVRRSFLKEGVETWGREMDARLGSPEHRFHFDDCHFGNASIARGLLARAGKFDESFTRFGNEDYDLGWRLIQLGAEMRYAPGARAVQIYDKGLFRWLRDCYCVGLADVVLERKHPSLASQLRFSRRERHPLKRLARLSALLPADPLAPAWGVAAAALAGLEMAGARGGILGHAQSLLGERQYWRGIRDARRRARPDRAGDAAGDDARRGTGSKVGNVLDGGAGAELGGVARRGRTT